MNKTWAVCAAFFASIVFGVLFPFVPSLGGATNVTDSSTQKSSIRILHLGDPQFGFCEPIDSDRSYAATKERMLKLIAKANVMRPDLVVISGDMCNCGADLVREWPDLIKRFEVPVAVVPGNHDLGQSVTTESLARFRRVFGRDRAAFDVGGWRFICGNSQFWYPTSLKDEQAEYERWVREELEKAKAYGGRVVLATHIPPFDKTPDEKDGYNNFPSKGRQDRLALYRAAGVRFYLAGHTHCHAERTAGGLTVLNPENTSWNFDCRPYGCRLLTLRPDFSYDYEFIEVK